MRHIHEARVVYVNSVRTDLCGGRGVTLAPTATSSFTLKTQNPQISQERGFFGGEATGCLLR
jgi:hypothetical protein